MGIFLKGSSSSGLTNPAASAETVVYTTPVLQAGVAGGPYNPISISGTFYVTAGTSATAITLRCRQGSLSGTQVGPSETITVAAASQYGISFGFTDTSSYLQGGGSYVITAQQTAGTVAGTANAIDVEVSN